MNNNNNNKPSKAQRKAQSARDKKASQQQSQPLHKQPKQRAPRKLKQAAAAAAYATGMVGKAPVIKMSRDTCRIVHRELVGSISSSDVFTVQETYALNPGLAASFPWLSVMAQGWEQYRFRKLRYCYYTRTGSNVPGSVILAPDYDAADAPPASEQIASAFEDVAEDAPWKDIECSLTQLSMAGGTTRHFTRNGPLAANLDIKTYDVGNMHVCTVDGSNQAVPFGKLWVEYDIEFFVPQLPPTGAVTIVGGSFTKGTAATGDGPMGTDPVSDPQNVGISILSSTVSSVITLERVGTYILTWTAGFTSGSAPVVTYSAGATVIAAGSIVNGASTSLLYVATFETTLVNQTVSLSFTLASGSVTFSTARIGCTPANSQA